MSYAKDTLLMKNKQYAETTFPGRQPVVPQLHTAVITCMDSRLDSFAMTGLKEGEAHHIRNGGGRAVDALRSIIASQTFLETKEIIIIHHTDCGLTKFDTPMLHEVLKKRLEPAFHPLVEALAALEIKDPEESVKQDALFLKEIPLILPGTSITGCVYDVDTGLLRKVIEL